MFSSTCLGLMKSQGFHKDADSLKCLGTLALHTLTELNHGQWHYNYDKPSLFLGIVYLGLHYLMSLLENGGVWSREYLAAISSNLSNYIQASLLTIATI